jgi:hypothetical protein
MSNQFSLCNINIHGKLKVGENFYLVKVKDEDGVMNVMVFYPENYHDLIQKRQFEGICQATYLYQLESDEYFYDFNKILLLIEKGAEDIKRKLKL